MDIVVNVVLLSIMLLIVAELFMCILYQIEFYISIQWKCFRFLALPILTTFLLRESVEPNQSDSAFASILFLVTFIISLILTAIFAYESYVYKKVLHRNLPVNWYLLIVETLFIGFEAFQD